MSVWFLGLVVALLLICCAIFIRKNFWILFSGDAKTNPFKNARPGRPKGERTQTSQVKRDEVLKEALAEDKVPPQLDAIVIGSGIGGLTSAALLAKAGRKVLVLEQHDQAGGCCHTFIDKGFEFDVGIHYIGEMAEGSVTRHLVDELSNGGIEWVKLEHVLDTVVLGDLANPSMYPIASDQEEFKNMLIGRFPDDKGAIVKFFVLVNELRSVTFSYVLLKLLPLWFAKFLLSSGLAVKLFPSLAYSTRTVAEVLNELTTNEELKSVITYLFGDYGTPPSAAPVTLHALLINHFKRGGYYPVGGASEIAFRMIPTIEAAGGKVLVRAKVVAILVEGGKVVGVRAKKGHISYEITAPLVISDAGIYNTVDLLPKPEARKSKLTRICSKVQHGIGYMSMFVGLEGTAAELGIKATNFWVFQGKNIEQTFSTFVGLPYQEAMKQPVPLMFVSFPSAKDPTYNDRYPGKSTCVIITVAPYEWFQEWADQRVTHRGDDYKTVKEAIAEQMWRQVLQLFPHLEDKKVYSEVGSPLSNCYYLNAPRGEIYGVDHNVARFDPELVAEMRPATDIPGLYLTGQDVLICGFSGAMYGGVLCASEVLKRNIMGDLLAAKKRTRKQD